RYRPGVNSHGVAQSSLLCVSLLPQQTFMGNAVDVHGVRPDEILERIVSFLHGQLERFPARFEDLKVWEIGCQEEGTWIRARCLARAYSKPAGHDRKQNQKIEEIRAGQRA